MPAGAQIENGLVVQLADRRAVGAFHVVGVDLQLRLGVGGGVVGEQQVLVGLLGVGLLRDGPDEDATVEDALGFVVEDAVEILVAGAMRLGVFDDHVVIGQLLAAREVKAVEDALQALAREVRCGCCCARASPRARWSGTRTLLARPNCAARPAM